MSSEIPQIETDAPEPTEEAGGDQQEPPRRRGSLAASLAILFSLAALAGTAWLWWQDQSSSGQGEQRLSAEIARLESGDSELARQLQRLQDEVDALSPADDRARLATLEGRLTADRIQLGQAERAIREQAALAQSLRAEADALYRRLQAVEATLSSAAARQADAGGELDLAEVDYLLRLANERLQLFADPVAADRALAVADRHLAAMDSPAYIGVRQEIAAARRALAAVDVPEYLAVAAALDAVQSTLPALPLRGAETSADIAVPTGEEGWWARLKNVFASLVTVRRSADDAEARISLLDEDYLRQRAWLQLEIARLALMRRDQAAFRGALGRARETLDAWFDPADSRVQSATGRLADLAALEVQPALPDITAPWSALQRIRAVRPDPVPVPAPPSADQTGHSTAEVVSERVTASAAEDAPVAEPPVSEPAPADGEEAPAGPEDPEREDTG